MERAYFVADASLSPRQSPLLLILRLLTSLQQLLDAVLVEPTVKLYKPLLDLLVGLSLEIEVEATREMTFGRNVCQKVRNIGEGWFLFAQNAEQRDCVGTGVRACLRL